MIVRDATEADIPAIVAMGERFFAVSGHSCFGRFDPDSLAGTLRTLVASDDGIVAVAEELSGVAVGLVYPQFFNHAHLTGQELFWWVEPGRRGNGRALLDALEASAKAMGATTFTMGALEARRPASVGRLLERKGYLPMEHFYTRTL